MDKLKEYLLRHKADLDVDSPASGAWEQIASKMSDSDGSHQIRFSTWVVRYAAAACLIALIGGGLWLAIKNKKMPSDTATYNSGTIKSGPAPGEGPAPGKEKAANTPGKEEKAPREELARGKEETALSKEEKNPGKELVLGKEEKTPGKELVRNEPDPKQAQHKGRSPKPVGISDEIDIIDKSYSSLIDYQLRKLRATPLYAENGSYFSFYVDQFKQMDQDEQAVRNDIKAYGLTNQFLEQLINVYQQKLNLLKNLQTEINKMNNKVREKQARSENAEVHYLDI